MKSVNKNNYPLVNLTVIFVLAKCRRRTVDELSQLFSMGCFASLVIGR